MYQTRALLTFDGHTRVVLLAGIDPKRLSFICERCGVIGKMARLAFPVGREDFAIEGLVTARLGTDGLCRYALSPMAAPHELLRLARALHGIGADGSAAPRPAAVAAPRPPRTPTADDIAKRRELMALYRAALRSS